MTINSNFPQDIRRFDSEPRSPFFDTLPGERLSELEQLIHENLRADRPTESVSRDSFDELLTDELFEGVKALVWAVYNPFTPTQKFRAIMFALRRDIDAHIPKFARQIVDIQQRAAEESDAADHFDQEKERAL